MMPLNFSKFLTLTHPSNIRKKSDVLVLLMTAKLFLSRRRSLKKADSRSQS